MSNPIRYSVGDQVTITPESLEIMKRGNRSIKALPCDSFVELASKYVGATGFVSHTFGPSYEVTVSFGNQNFHMKDNWIEAKND